MTTSIDIARRIAEVNHPLSRESVDALAEILVCRKYRKGVVWELPRVEVEKLIDQYHDIERLYRSFIEHSLIESQVKADTLRFEPAHERYNKLLQLHPEILKRAPLVYIASLLQMTPETLSRVRSSLL